VSQIKLKLIFRAQLAPSAPPFKAPRRPSSNNGGSQPEQKRDISAYFGKSSFQ